MLKKFFASVIAILLVISVFPFAVFAESTEVKSGTTGDCTWTLDGTVLTISGNGKMKNYASNDGAPWGKNITEVIINNGVTNIGDSSFFECKKLTNIVISDTVTDIGSFAFLNCDELIDIILPDSIKSIGNHAFSGCKGLINIGIPEGIKSIGDGTFYNCIGLTSIVIPDRVTRIGEYAFKGCKGLTSITIPYSVTNIDRMAFYDCENLNEVNITDIIKWCNIDFYDAYSNPLYYAHNLYLNGEAVKKIVIPENMTKIKNYIFYNCIGLTKVTIPNSVESIGDYAFRGCGGLTSIIIPNSITSIGEYTFANCSGLTSVKIPNSITSISNGTFYNCTGLTSIIMPDCIKSIGSYAFDSCMELTNITIPESVISMGESAFGSCRKLVSVIISDGVTSIGNSAFSNCVALKSIIIPSSVKNIGKSAFGSCRELTSLTIYNSETSIGERAFRYCNKLTSITIPNGVKSLGNHAFYDCTNLREVHINDIEKWCNIDFNDMYSNPLYYAHNLYLNGEAVKEIVLPETVTEIKDYAFYNCTGLTKITIPESVTSIGNNAFTGCSDLIIETDSYDVYEYANLHGITVIMINNWIGSEKNPIVSVEVPDIKIIENTNGTQMDGYYYYNNFLLKCIASYKDGEKKYDYAHIEYGELEKQQTEHWTAGNTYSIKVEYDGIHTTVNVTVIENPIEKIDIPDVVLEDGFIEANLYEHPQYTVTLKNGTVVESDDGAAYSNYVLIEDKEYELEINLDSEYIESLKAGDRCKVECELAGIKASYYVNIVNSPFKAIYIDDVVSERDDSGYNYAPRSGIVELINGEKIKFFGTELTFNGKYYSIGYNYQYNTPFTPGNTYEITATLGNLSTTYKVTVLKSQEQPVITNYEMTKKPTKTEYIVGEVPDWRGAVIRLSFSDGSFEDLSVPESLWPDDDGYIKLFSNKLSKYIVFFPVFESWDHWINSTDISNIKLGVWGSDKLPTPVVVAECPVTVKKNEWENIKITDYYTLNSKMTVTDKYGNTSVFNIRGLASYGGWGGGDPWLYNSQELHGMVLYTDKGLFWIDLYCWVNEKDKFFNIYINNKKLKSNTICGSPFDNIPEKLDRLCNNIFYENNNDYSMLSFSKYGEIRYINGKYYFEKEFVYRDGTCKIMYMSLDSNFEMVDYIFGFCKGYFDGNDNHEWGEWTVTKPAGCTVNGEEQRICSKCGDSETKVIKALGHKKGEAVTENRTEPTCTKDGSYDSVVYCDVCKAGLSRETKIIPALGHTYGEATVTAPEYGKEGYSEHECTVCGYKEKFDFTEVLKYPMGQTLVFEDGVWKYVSDGELAPEYTGLVKYYGTWYYVENGILNWDYTGLTNYYGTWYYVEGGILNWSYTGLTNYYGTWYYVEDGILNWSYTGLTNYYGTWYYVEGGILNWGYTGLTNYYGTWYYVEGGVLNWGYTGLTRYYGTWYYVANGVLDWNYTGSTYYYGTWYYVQGGVLR